MTLKHVGWFGLALLLAALSGWIAGASGRSDREQARVAAVQRAELAEARALILGGRVSLFQSNFGDAGRQFEEARAAIERVQTNLRETAQAERAGRLQIAIAHVRDAQSLAAAFDAAAHAAAEEALKVIAGLSTSPPSP